MSKCKIVIVYAAANNSGKDTIVDMIMNSEQLASFKLAKMSLSAPVIASYMVLFNEASFDFYKQNSSKRLDVLSYSTAVKKIDPYAFIRKTTESIKAAMNEDVDFIFIPDCRYEYEAVYLLEHISSHDFDIVGIEILRNNNTAEEYADRESQYTPFTKEACAKYGFGDLCIDNSYDLENTMDQVKTMLEKMCND